jgi:hypothetical protein
MVIDNQGCNKQSRSELCLLCNIEKAMDEQKQESDYIERLETLQESR